MKPLVIGTRGSTLALVQAKFVQECLRRLTSSSITLKPMATRGDQIPGQLQSMGGKSLFTKEIEDALLQGTIDLAVHSLKDVAAELPAGLVLSAILRRDDPHDVFLSERFATMASMPSGARLGTSSLRRGILAAKINPQLKIVELRGNIDTRLKKLAAGKIDGLILAQAGLVRCGLTASFMESLAGRMLPAVGQGALAIETRADHHKLNELLRDHLHNPVSAACVTAERQFMRRLGATCDTPIAALGTAAGEKLTLAGWVASRDGSREIQETVEGNVAEPEILGDRLADHFMAQGALQVIASSEGARRSS